MTPEGKLKKQVKDYLKSLDAYFFMPVPTGYGATTLDFLCSIRGRFVAIETKAPGKKATLRQLQVMREINKSGGIAFETDNFDKARDIIRKAYFTETLYLREKDGCHRHEGTTDISEVLEG